MLKDQHPPAAAIWTQSVSQHRWFDLQPGGGEGDLAPAAARSGQIELGAYRIWPLCRLLYCAGEDRKGQVERERWSYSSAVKERQACGRGDGEAADHQGKGATGGTASESAREQRESAHYCLSGSDTSDSCGKKLLLFLKWKCMEAKVA
ncbi:hypothetical protein E2562_006915 [Oryza meyeriana var. granulata]|uniref:Uncharacterized protein n=1 Tax=Oryza meyeriana var. granulata TaxID=110450 RepID=A0A6G1BJ96_9ORYZ|nr:hypothetical protein E2562_006915 [Oryza meyeriana var. granulata]